MVGRSNAGRRRARCVGVDDAGACEQSGFGDCGSRDGVAGVRGDGYAARVSGTVFANSIAHRTVPCSTEFHPATNRRTAEFADRADPFFRNATRCEPEPSAHPATNGARNDYAHLANSVPIDREPGTRARRRARCNGEASPTCSARIFKSPRTASRRSSRTSPSPHRPPKRRPWCAPRRSVTDTDPLTCPTNWSCPRASWRCSSTMCSWIPARIGAGARGGQQIHRHGERSHDAVRAVHQLRPVADRFHRRHRRDSQGDQRTDDPPGRRVCQKPISQCPPMNYYEADLIENQNDRRRSPPPKRMPLRLPVNTLPGRRSRRPSRSRIAWRRKC